MLRTQLTARCALAGLSGVLLTMLYPPFDFAALGWIALAPLLVAVRGATVVQSLGLGWLCGTLGGIGVTGWWIGRAAADYFGMPPPLAALFSFAVIQLFVSPAFAAFGVLAARLLARRGALITVPAAFVACEYARAHLLGGNPWALLGQSQSSLELVQLCDLTGVYGLSFLLAMSAYALAEFVTSVLSSSITPRSFVSLSLVLASVTAALVYGRQRLTMIDASRGESLQVEMVQGNLGNDERGRPEQFEHNLDRYLQLTRSVQGPTPQLIVWPEQAVGFFLDDNPQLMQRITDTLRGGDALLLTGAPRSVATDGVAALYNSAYLIGAGGVIGVYDKRVLLPFVERVPLRPQDGPYQAGQRAGSLAVNDRQFAVLICYEAIYATLAGDLRRSGAQWLVNISNDSWFSAGGGSQQHLQAVRLRAIEQRISIIRVTNSGISAVIDPSGREIARLPSDTAAALSVRVPSTTLASPYTTLSDVFAWGCIAVTAMCLWRRRSRD